MILADRYYKDNLEKLYVHGSWDENPRPKYKDGEEARTKFITHVFETYNLDLGEFPITTLRNTAIKGGIQEVFWIYKLQSNKLEDLRKLGVHWWDEFDVGDGTIGKRYGYTVKKYNLMVNLLGGLIRNPFDRGHIMSLWQEDDLKNGPGLRPCSFESLWSVRKSCGIMYLDMALVQRSNDYIMAGYINKVQYVALQMMVANHCGYQIGKFSHLVNNLHYYTRHEGAVEELLAKKSLDIQPKLILDLPMKSNFWNMSIDDFTIVNTGEITKIKSPLELAI